MRPGKSHLNVGKDGSQLARLSKEQLARGFQEKVLRRLMPYK
jgi:ribosomal protein L35